MSRALDPKSIYQKMQQCADGIAINECDLKSTNNIDEVFDFITDEILPEIIKQLSYIQGLREKLRVEECEGGFYR